MEQLDPATRAHVEKGLDSLKDEFAGVFSPETVERYVNESLEHLSGARLRNFVPLFVHRFARERLRALGQVEGTIGKDVPEVLFVCVQNAGRSQMAAGLLDRAAESRVHVRSCGSEPADEVNPNVVQAMAEADIDVSREFPKPMTDEVVRAADVVVTMGCGTPARSIRASDTRTGRSPILPARTWKRFVRSARRSGAGWSAFSPS